MDVRVLGPVEVVDDRGVVVRLGAPREQAVLVWLAVRAPETVSARNLIDVLWADSPPASAAKTLQTLVHRLRKSVGSGVVETIGSGYRLAVDPEQIDVRRAERFGREGRRLIS